MQETSSTRRWPKERTEMPCESCGRPIHRAITYNPDQGPPPEKTWLVISLTDDIAGYKCDYCGYFNVFQFER